jgi:RNA polymerase sigma-70 factor, ECF subfamily
MNLQSPALCAPSDFNEQPFIRRLRAGDEAAFEILVREHAGAMLAVAHRYLPNESDAQDAVQDAFVSAFKSIDRFEGTSKLSTWLHRITVNAALMKLRTARRRPTVPLNDLLPTFDATGHQTRDSAPWRSDSEPERAETRALVRQCIDQLPDPYRVILLLRDIEGFDTAAVAAQLSLTDAAVKTRLHRARQALRTLLDPHMRLGAD